LIETRPLKGEAKMTDQSQPIAKLILAELRIGDMFLVKTTNTETDETSEWFLIVTDESPFPDHSGGKGAYFHKKDSGEIMAFAAFIPQKRIFEVEKYLFAVATPFRRDGKEPVFHRDQERITSIQRLKAVVS
jgi:hypothetical protein